MPKLDPADPRLDQLAKQLGLPSNDSAPGEWVWYCDGCGLPLGFDTLNEAIGGSHILHTDESCEDGEQVVMSGWDFEHNGVAQWLAGFDGDWYDV